MKKLITLKPQDFLTDSTQIDFSGFSKRTAARAVLLNKQGEVYLLNVSKHGYHKLPGGGVDRDEEIEQALERELLEEVGCRAEVLVELGETVEYRAYDDGGLEQVSFAYLARQVGEQVPSALEEGEIEEGMFEVRAKSIDDAIAILSHDTPDNLEGRYIQKRDMSILEEAKRVFANIKGV